MKTIAELEAALKEARERWSRAARILASGLQGTEEEAHVEGLYEAERALAAAKGEPYAVPIDFPVAWDFGAPLPHLLQNDSRAILISVSQTSTRIGMAPT